MGSRNRFEKREYAPRVPTPVRSRAENRRSSSNPVRPSEQESTAERIKRREAAGLRNHREGGIQNRSSVQPIDGSYRKGVEAGKDGKVTYGTLPPNAGRTIYPAEETYTNAAGIVQTGKNLGGGGTPIDMTKSFDTLLKETVQQPFGGTQLPTTMGNPYTATYKQTAGFGDAVPDIGGMNGATYDSEGGRNALNATNLQNSAPFNPGAPLIEGGSERIAQQSTGISSNRLSDALEGVKTQEANREMTPERRQQMASMAFLNGKDSMSGLKARDAVNDVVYAGGQHYGRGALSEDSGLGDKYKIDRAEARDIASGKQSAAGLLESYKSRITEASKETPAEAQDPVTTFQQGMNSGLSVAPSNSNQLTTRDFDLNNDEGTGFAAPKGYKPQSSYKDPAFPNPFG